MTILLGTLKQKEEIGEVRIELAHHGVIYLCQGQQGSVQEQIIEIDLAEWEQIVKLVKGEEP